MSTKDFNNCRQAFSKEEIEQLCSLYLEGNLDVEEERALAKILANSSYSGEMVEETLFLMGVAASECHMIKGDANILKKADTSKFHLWRPLFNILKTCAATVCIIFSVSMIWNYFDTPRIVAEPLYEVYANGMKVSDPEKSKQLALKDYEDSKRFIAEMMAIENENMMDLEKKKLDADRVYKEIKLYLNEIN